MSSHGRLLGIDFGDVRIGLAICDAAQVIASPLATYVRADAEGDARFFQQLVMSESVAGLVVGLPIHLDGREGEKAAQARAFGRWLAEITKLPVVFWDERFTTVDAERALLDAGLTNRRRKARRDRVAAQIMLQAYLDAGCPKDPVLGPLH